MTNVKVYFVNDAIDQLKIDTWDTIQIQSVGDKLPNGITAIGVR